MSFIEKNLVHKGELLKGAFFPAHSKQGPVVILGHAWGGQDDFIFAKAQQFNEIGLHAYAWDLYGDRRHGKNKEENSSLMGRFMEDRKFLRQRLLSILDDVKQFSEVDKNKVAAIGFCFGGLCVLDLARAGADICGVVSFHGLLGRPQISEEKVKAKVLALHGYDDPMATPPHLNEFCDEMTALKVDWQVHVFGNTMHAFTNPEAHDASFGTVYNQISDQRSWKLANNFLTEVFGS